MAEAFSERVRVRRLAERGVYDREKLDEIFDEALICHVGFIADGDPYVIPTIHARHDDTIYFHGSPASRMLRLMKKGADVCVTATIVDGIVAARSAFHHSMNYRSAVVLGSARLVDDDEERLLALEMVTQHVLPGRWSESRQPSDVENRGTSILALPIEEYSVKIRSGPPVDDEADYELDIWAGVIPLTTSPGEPEPDPRLLDGIEVAPSVVRFSGR
ncbi:MAG: pyridoxamine 5'-phosphate oxidase family protein [Acidimicrobiia bacterium]|nr:MAG: pyridoxamine 5'-phosphate oxidase family protein [Acidimicrobiia bacterium]